MASSRMLLYLDHEILFGETFTVGFSFFQDKLFGLSYMLNNEKECEQLRTLIATIIGELTRKYGASTKDEGDKLCSQRLEWNSSDSQVKFDSEKSVLDQVRISISYRHMATVAKVRDADKERSKSKL